MESSDVLIIGGGIVGLATGYEFTRRFPKRTVRILEKEADLALHQTGRNSGVIHSGIYYKPGSLKASNCREGKAALERFCRQHEIPFQTCGKIIVAVDDKQLPALDRIHQRGLANGVSCRRITQEQLHEREPHAHGVGAIHVPSTGIVSFRQVSLQMAEEVRQRGGDIRLECRALKIRSSEQPIVVETTRGTFGTRTLVNCGGLFSDRITAKTGLTPAARIIPFRGEYYELRPASQHLCRHLIYPVADPKLPFLGVHFTRMIGGGVECGPNAVLAWAREGYRHRDINLRDLWETVSYPGFWRLARTYWKTGLDEFHRSLSKRAFVRALQRLVPDVRAEDLIPHRAGVRAQAVDRDGSMIDDFLIQTAGQRVNVGNAPSPAATASLQIARSIVDQLAANSDL